MAVENIEQAITVLAATVAFSEEQLVGLAAVAEFCEKAQNDLALVLGSGNEQVAIFAAAVAQVQTCQQLLVSTKTELEQTQDGLARMQ